MDPKSLGIRTDNIKDSLLPYFLLTLVSTLVIGIVFKRFSPDLLPIYHALYPFFYLSIPLSILQEAVFRGYGIYKLRSFFKNPAAVIFIDAVLFAAMHLFIGQPQILVPLAFFGGIGFATAYYYFPNLYLVSAVHVMLNLLIIPFCYFGLALCL